MVENDKSQATVRIDNELAEACKEWAAATEAHNIKNGVRVGGGFNYFYVGKLCEMAASIYLGADPMATINPIGERDLGHDIKIGDLEIDVKGSDHQKAELLLFPVTRVLSSLADVLISATCTVTADGPEFVTLRGWVEGRVFRKAYKTADQVNRWNLKEGTPFIHNNELVSMVFLKSYTSVKSEKDLNNGR